MRYWIWLLLLCGCTPSSSKDFQQEGEARCRLLIKDLQKIETRDQLLSQESHLKKHFEALVDLMIAAREFQERHWDDFTQDPEENSAEAPLQEELRRIYAIEGGREIVERAEHEALVRLDGYMCKLAKKSEKLKVREVSR